MHSDKALFFLRAAVPSQISSLRSPRTAPGEAPGETEMRFEWYRQQRERTGCVKGQRQVVGDQAVLSLREREQVLLSLWEQPSQTRALLEGRFSFKKAEERKQSQRVWFCEHVCLCFLGSSEETF
ncbi:MAG: uncharacterized protein A8A55_2584 [Amphiamblys sp. WSBS2006]|nr:MAG: uncharacterized protein A8A55_2584 [Amphiamblys sp. WSBS2006]